MSMFPHWFGSQKAATPQFDTTCPNPNCHRRFELAMIQDACPFCDCKLTKRPLDGAKAPKKSKRSAGSPRK